MDRRGGFLVAAALAAAGCATTPADPVDSQRLAVSTATAAGAPVDGLDCVLRNDKGEWTVRTPGSVLVRRSSEPLVLRCEGPDWQMAPGAADRIGARSGALPAAAIGGGVGGAAAGAVISAGAGGGAAVAAVAAGPFFLFGATLGAGLGWLAGRRDAAHHYPGALVVTVEPRPVAAR